MSFFRGLFTRRTAVPSTDTDVEAQNSPTVELRTSTREEDGVVIVDQTPAQPSNESAASGGEPTGDAAQTAASMAAQIDLEVLVSTRLALIKKTSQIMLVLTVLQIMSTLGTEHIHFLSLFSLFVPWTGFEGAKERNFAYLRAFYWGCWIMIPANLFHYISVDQFVDQILQTPLDENVRKELVFNHVLFNVVTIIIMVGMTFCLVWVRQLSVMIRSLRHFVDHDFMEPGRRPENRGPTGPLTTDEISAIPAIKLEPQDIGGEGAEKDVCVICQDEFQVNDLAKRLNCRHVFHAQCIDAWLERSSSCPICNGEVRSIV